MPRKFVSILLLLVVFLHGDYLEKGFLNPPNEAKPQAWWHWMNCNITKEGIKADLEAMAKIGVGGLTILDIGEGIPEGNVPTASPEWFDMVQYTLEVAESLGLEVNLHNCPGWSSSGGPWVTKENAMKKVTYASTDIEGGKHVVAKIPMPPVTMDFYHEIALLAFPKREATATLIPGFQGKALYPGNIDLKRGPNPPPEALVNPDAIINISKYMDADGILKWDAPAGNWTILRLGYTLIGRYNHPCTRFGRGLECDKMSKKGVKAAWDGQMGIVVKNAGKLSGKTLKGSLIDSYEVGPQNWTDTFAEDFKRLRGYAIDPYLPVLAGYYVKSQDVSERFLDDFRRTIADLFSECYAEYFNKLCKEANLEFLSEPYGGPFDDLLQGRTADIPMGEFWGVSTSAGNAAFAGNIAQVYGRKIAGTESFTAAPASGRWQSHPAAHKIQGDKVFSHGVNRYIFHSYAHQPWTRNSPGMTMGQWGFHFNRHNTLWDNYSGWLAYIARSQFLLQQGRAVCDALYVAQQKAPCGENYSPGMPQGYRANCIDSRSFIESTTVKNGRIYLPHGMNYRILVVTKTEEATPQLLQKVLDLAKDGATILLGPKTRNAFGLENYPQSDQDIQKLVSQIWGDMDGKNITSRNIGKGRVFFGVNPQAILDKDKVIPDFSYTTPGKSSPSILFLHKYDDKGNDWYFVSNQQKYAVEATLKFRITGKVPEIWSAESGKIAPAAAFKANDDSIEVPYNFKQSESIFVMFRNKATDKNKPAATAFEWTAKSTKGEGQANSLTIDKALYKAIDGAGQKDVTKLLQDMVTKQATLTLVASNEVLGGDPAYLHLKTLDINYTYNGKKFFVSISENATVDLPTGSSTIQPFQVERKPDGSLKVVAWQNGTLNVVSPAGSSPVVFDKVPEPIQLEGPWNVSFPQGLGAPNYAQFPKLASYTESKIDGIKYFSGTSTYMIEFDFPADQLGKPVMLDLGRVQVMARVNLNGEDCGLLWLPPYSTIVTDKLKAGKNELKIQVTNRWVNRIIGDDFLPQDADWNGVRLANWPQWFLDGKPSPTGRIAFTTWKHWSKNDSLLEAGLIGPVLVRIGQAK